MFYDQAESHVPKSYHLKGARNIKSKSFDVLVSLKKQRQDETLQG